MKRKIQSNTNYTISNMNIRKYVFLLLLLPIISYSLYAQRDCPTALQGYLKPIGDTGINWAVEAMLSGGGMTDAYILDNALFVGVEYVVKKHLFFVEGGSKFWAKDYTEIGDGLLTSNQSFGLRELMYKYNGDDIDVSVGMHTSGLNDFFVLDERAFAVNAAGEYKKINYTFSAGTVMANSARNGKFCSRTYLYDINPDRERAYLGKKPGETNYIGLSAYWDFEKETIVESSNDEFEESDEEFESTDEFEENNDEFSESDEEFESSDEFAEDNGDEFSEPVEAKKKDKKVLGFFKMKKFGVLLFDEFGSYSDVNKFLGGIFLEIDFPLGLTFKHEVLYQEYLDNRGIIIYLHLDRSFFWGNQQRTILYGDYYKMLQIDENAICGLPFSNIFAGPVFRLDAIDIPFYSLAIKHSLMKHRLSFVLRYSHQQEGDHMKELDLQIVKRLGKHLKLSGLAGMFNADFLDDTNYIGQIELRFSL